MRHFRPFFLWVLAASLCLTGCSHRQSVKALPVKKVVTPVVLHSLPLDLSKVQPNEAGMVPILEYHDLVASAKIKDYEYSAASFQKDLDWLYAHRYRPVSLSEYVQGKIDVPAGMSPVILTFDDALRGQFHYTDNGKIDPSCAVGILDAFHAKHSDWPLKGTFFVLTDGDPHLPPAFYQKDYAQGKMEYLVKEGYEIGNHTIHHRMGIRRWSDAQVATEFAGAVANIQALLPGYNVQTLALPYGVFPKNQKLVVSGESGGVKYHNICALLAGANPAPSPMSQKFNPYRLARIIPGDRKTPPGRLNTIRWWLAKMEKNRTEKFVSDGDPNTYTVNLLAKGQLNAARLKNNHFLLRTYNGTQMLASK